MKNLGNDILGAIVSAEFRGSNDYEAGNAERSFIAAVMIHERVIDKSKAVKKYLNFGEGVVKFPSVFSISDIIYNFIKNHTFINPSVKILSLPVLCEYEVSGVSGGCTLTKCNVDLVVVDRFLIDFNIEFDV